MVKDVSTAVPVHGIQPPPQLTPVKAKMTPEQLSSAAVWLGLGCLCANLAIVPPSTPGCPLPPLFSTQPKQPGMLSSPQGAGYGPSPLPLARFGEKLSSSPGKVILEGFHAIAHSLMGNCGDLGPLEKLLPGVPTVACEIPPGRAMPAGFGVKGLQ